MQLGMYRSLWVTVHDLIGQNLLHHDRHIRVDIEVDVQSRQDSAMDATAYRLYT